MSFWNRSQYAGVLGDLYYTIACTRTNVLIVYLDIVDLWPLEGTESEGA